MNTTNQRAMKASAFCIAAFCLVPGASASIFRNETSNPRRALSQQQDSWYTGTATWYGGPDGPGPDGMSIYTGSCKYGKNIPSHFVSAINTDGGYDYGALRAREFGVVLTSFRARLSVGLTDLCGQCFEVMCVDGRQRGLEDSILGPWAVRLNAWCLRPDSMRRFDDAALV